ncbi:MAG TPA: DUF2332 domain-containing protein [Gammaproteobacteria bacterium]|nr:DUF2332 domain-containing protein [Gammaproteobacteria bacterium]
MTGIDRQIDVISERFANFADEARGSSALYATLSPDIANDAQLLELLLVAPPMQRRANLLFAAVHDLLFRDASHPVSRYYPSVNVSPVPPDRAAFPTFRDFCLSNRAQLEGTMAARQTQTNEVRRTIAFVPVFQRLAEAEPIALVEVGASAGLNLLVDRYRYRYGDGPWLGAVESPVALRCDIRGTEPPVLPAMGEIAYRIGIDTHPLNVSEPDDARWLMACVWPEQTDRLERLRAALAIAREAPPAVVSANALDALEEVLSDIPDDLTICVFNSATLFYLSDDDCARFVSLLDRLASPRLHWLSLEGGAVQTFGAKLPFDRLYEPRPDDQPTDIFGLIGYSNWKTGKREDRLLGRADMHGRWIEWQ